MVYGGVEQDVERLPSLAVDAVVGDEQALEERLVRDAPKGVVHARVGLVGVAGEGEAVVQVGAGCSYSMELASMRASRNPICRALRSCSDLRRPMGTAPA